MTKQQEREYDNLRNRYRQLRITPDSKASVEKLYSDINTFIRSLTGSADNYEKQKLIRSTVFLMSALNSLKQIDKLLQEAQSNISKISL